jgi:mannitol-specific phosphotransferase system IIBC component
VKLCTTLTPSPGSLLLFQDDPLHIAQEEEEDISPTTEAKKKTTRTQTMKQMRTQTMISTHTEQQECRDKKARFHCIRSLTTSVHGYSLLQEYQ